MYIPSLSCETNHLIYKNEKAVKERRYEELVASRKMRAERKKALECVEFKRRGDFTVVVLDGEFITTFHRIGKNERGIIVRAIARTIKAMEKKNERR